MGNVCRFFSEDNILIDIDSAVEIATIRNLLGQALTTCLKSMLIRIEFTVATFIRAVFE